jgi:transcriptional regulator with XRE-family HTH domain
MSRATRQAKAMLRARGWSYRRGAVALGVTYQHLSMVLNGHRESRRLLQAIAELPDSPVPYMPVGFVRGRRVA